MPAYRHITNAAPFEILIACTSKFLPSLIYEKLTYTKTIGSLLGWGAFAGFIVLWMAPPQLHREAEYLDSEERVGCEG